MTSFVGAIVSLLDALFGSSSTSGSFASSPSNASSDSGFLPGEGSRDYLERLLDDFVYPELVDYHQTEEGALTEQRLGSDLLEAEEEVLRMFPDGLPSNLSKDAEDLLIDALVRHRVRRADSATKPINQGSP